jgi:enoyl-CoA hydratase
VAYQHIEYEIRDRIAMVRMNRPAFRNAQSRRMLEEMDQAFLEAERDPQVKVVILQGKGEHFSSGHDLGTAEEKADEQNRPYAEGAVGQLQKSWDLYVDTSLRWRDLKKPTIAQVQGYCIFGGYLVASVMDLIMAADDALFLPSHLQLFTAPWDLGIRRAKAVLFENRFISAQEAFDYGLVHKVIPRAQLEEECWAQAERIARNDSLTLRTIKSSINSAEDAMGYRTSVHSAHSNFMVLALGGKVRKGDEVRLKGVEFALNAAGKKSD